MPDVTILLRTEDAPGMEKIGIFSSIHLCTNESPGSDINGVPASEIIDIIEPSLSLFIILGISLVELNL